MSCCVRLRYWESGLAMVYVVCYVVRDHVICWLTKYTYVVNDTFTLTKRAVIYINTHLRVAVAFVTYHQGALQEY